MSKDLLIKIAKGAKRGVIRVPHNHMVKDFDFKKLTGADKVTDHFDGIKLEDAIAKARRRASRQKRPAAP